MEINLLNEKYDSSKLYKDFIDGTISPNSEYVSDKTEYLNEAPDFPIYLAKKHTSESEFKSAIKTLKKSYISTSRDIHMNGLFWHSLLTIYKRDYIVKKYPEVLESESEFKNIVLKKFGWENYIYKCLLVAEYIEDSGFSEAEEDQFIHAVVNNLDVYNYIIKYKLFRNRQFIVKFLNMIQENGLSSIMKRKIKDRSDLGSDTRYGRQVVFELNKSYPILMAPFMDKEELLEKSKEILVQYGVDLSTLTSNKN